MAAETMVRTYKSADAYAKDAAKLAKDGWSVVTTANQQPRAGCGRMLAIGIFAAIWKPKPVIVVTYSREKKA